MNMTPLYRILAVTLLAGFGLHHYALTRKPAGAEKYHERIREAAKLLPSHIGGWVGEDVPVPTRTNSVLRPNVIVSRRYTNVENGLSAGLLLVHCSDAHSMAGHYPLRCYPAQGWTLKESRPRDWASGGLRMNGTEYGFVVEELGQTKSIIVANWLFLPGGKVLRDMNGMARTVFGVGGQASGAGQLQIYFDSNMPREQRDRAIEELIGGYRGTIEAILSDVGP
jgi:hypothetical protein